MLLLVNMTKTFKQLFYKLIFPLLKKRNNRHLIPFLIKENAKIDKIQNIITPYVFVIQKWKHLF